MINSSENKWFDSFIRNKYYKHTLPPDDKMWKRINIHLTSGKSIYTLRKIRNLKIAIAGLAAALVGTFIYYQIDSPDKTNQNIELSGSSGIRNDSTGRPNKILPYRPQDRQNNVSLNSPDDSASLSEIHKKKNRILQTPEEKIVQEMGKSIMTSPASTISDSSYKKQSKEVNHLFSKRSYANRNTKKQLASMENNFPDNTAGRSEDSGIELLPLKRNSTFVSSKFIENAESNKLLITNYSQAVTPNLEGIRKNLAIQENKGIAGFQLEGNSSGAYEREFSFGLYLGSAYTYRLLTENSAFSTSPYGKTYFNNRDQGNLTYSTGANLTYGLLPGFRIKVGFSFNNYSFDFKTQASYINYDAYNSWLYTSAGTMDFNMIVTDTLSPDVLLNSKIKFSYLSIPLGVEYDITPSLFVNIGMDMSFLIGKDLQMEAVDYTGDFNFQMEDIRKLHPYNINMLLGIGIKQTLYKNMSLIFNPTLHVSLMSLNKEAPVNSYPYAMGMQLGLRYYF